MPRCLMAKKWKPAGGAAAEDSDEEIDVVGEPAPAATAPGPPPRDPEPTTLYNGYTEDQPSSHFTSRLPSGEAGTTTQPVTYAVLQLPADTGEYQYVQLPPTPPPPPLPPHPQPKSHAMCFTSTGAALSLPPKKKDIYRPYCLGDRQDRPPTRVHAEEDLHAAHAILDLSQHALFLATTQPLPQSLTPQPSVIHSSVIQATGVQQPVHLNGIHPNIGDITNQTSVKADVVQHQPIIQHTFVQQSSIHQTILQPTVIQVTPFQPASPQRALSEQYDRADSPSSRTSSPEPRSAKTVAYTYDAFFVSDGRSKRRNSTASTPDLPPTPPELKAKYTCGECGKRYATSSNLSRHKQTHRSLDSVSAKRCGECGKAYVSMPALAMHVLTHRLSHVCGVCGKLFSRPWLLQGHLRSHTGEKPYGCAHCGKAFADRSNLRAHMQTHSADKNFECQRCHKTFALKSYLNKHQEAACNRDDDLQFSDLDSP